jgi:hypothetical protein
MKKIVCFGPKIRLIFLVRKRILYQIRHFSGQKRIVYQRFEIFLVWKRIECQGYEIVPKSKRILYQIRHYFSRQEKSRIVGTCFFLDRNVFCANNASFFYVENVLSNKNTYIFHTRKSTIY